MVPHAPKSPITRGQPARHRGLHEDRGRRSRYQPGYDEFREVENRHTSYWYQTRRPLPNLLFILPIVGLYEIGAAQLEAAGARGVRTGIDRWIMVATEGAGVTFPWVLPAILLTGMIAWFLIAGPRAWQVRLTWLPAMVLESAALGLAMIGLSRLVDRGLSWIVANPLVLAAGGSDDAGLTGLLAPLVSFLGAGLYEEAVFRLLLVPVLYGFFRLVQAPDIFAGTLAITGSAMAFSIAHHVGLAGEVFTWYAFLFRWLAGIAFAWIFIVRGFGIAVGAHIAYDLLVGTDAWGG